MFPIYFDICERELIGARGTARSASALALALVRRVKSGLVLAGILTTTLFFSIFIEKFNVFFVQQQKA